MGDSNGICPLCGGEKQPGTTTFTADLGTGVVVVRDIPAMVCSQCGADWIPDEQAASIEQVVRDARKSHRQIEVTTLS